jgi:signal transduction histidine kinase
MNTENFQYYVISGRFVWDLSPTGKTGGNNPSLNYLCKSLILSLLILCFSDKVSYGQTPIIDSLKKELSDPKSDKLSTLFALGWQGESMPADTLMMYAKKAKQISLQNRDNQAFLQSIFFIAKSFNLKGRSDSSLRLCNWGMEQITDIKKMPVLFHQFMWYKIVSLTKLRKIKESIEECYQLLQSAEKYPDFAAHVIAFNNLGVNNNILGNRKEALDWFNKAYASIKNDSSYKKFPLVFTNLSAVYYSAQKTDSGGFFLKKAFLIARGNQNLRSESDCFSLQALVYMEENKMDSAELTLKKAVALQKQIGNIQLIIVGLDALETFYGKQKNYPKAVEYIRQAQEFSRKYEEPLSFSFYTDLAECYRQMQNYMAYGQTMDTLMLLKDSMYAKSKAQDLAQLEAQYELSTKEAFIAEQKLELLHKDIWIFSAGALSLVIILGVYLLYRRNRRMQAIALTQAEEKERRRIAADLHDNIGAYASAISAGIEEIESRKLISDVSSIQNLKSNASEIMTSLRDTIWAFNKDSITLTGISDRVKIYTQKIQPAYPQVFIDVEEDISLDKKLSPVQALHIFRIIQEALHNALRHSRCSKVFIHIISNEEVSEITIEDNGDGFDPEKVSYSGNGLLNMKSRALEAGYELAFNKADPKGTQVRLSIKKGRS